MAGEGGLDVALLRAGGKRRELQARAKLECSLVCGLVAGITALEPDWRAGCQCGAGTGRSWTGGREQRCISLATTASWRQSSFW